MIVNIIEPKHGTVLDPACGSGGMFVQTAHYIEKHRVQGKQMNLRAYGVEKTGATVRLAKMNLVLNGVDLKQRKYGYYYGYGNYGRYGRYGSYGHYGHYGSYGHYGDDTSVSKRRGKGWVSEERFDK